ncbi:glycoside hydrolase family 2 protein [Ruminiclostridium cellobioparum]|uniref:Beta-galactosidase/beta-glucuronidase n=1 Tax=Ruminiclostridium cellobioparum subsp. termitidis CT1112 TaxID=1195236 RepID=S0FPK1_RUMCE|nr:sugar-binding domain-containing protein [Ruminiclostridium cellobioparum]EMS73797.1 Beta-galactosidase/beta-glucuronidase [Ruminiclostridium cellobioparum subsp. termitidis CT1112]
MKNESMAYSAGINAKGPRPDFYRDNFILLNGEWEFAFDDKAVGLKEDWQLKEHFEKRINVPFCYQSKASGIGDISAHPVVWYKRTVEIPEKMLGKNLWLCFGAVDYEATVWINGKFAVKHKGGHTPFQVQITDYLETDTAALKDGRQTAAIAVRAFDPYDVNIPRGKQHWNIATDRCWYTATTGIWQDVWLEAVDGIRINRVKITPDIDLKQAHVELFMDGDIPCGRIDWNLKFSNRCIREGAISVKGKSALFTIDVEEEDPINNNLRLWSCENPNLYDLEISLSADGRQQDKVLTYFGMRKIEVQGDKILLNNLPLYQRLVLDQGYWPDTLLTPPSDEAIIEDIELIKALGFNGARKHQKIESAKFYYYADVLGLLVWEEMPSAYKFDDVEIGNLIPEWIEAVERDYNHPCIITWVPFNESWGVRDILHNKEQQAFARSLYYITKALDKTRLVSTNDGWEMVTSDICGIHDYVGDGGKLYDKYLNKDELLAWTAVGKMLYSRGHRYEGQPVIISEFGGVAFEDGNDKSWGYNGKVAGEEQFLKRVDGLVKAIEKLEYTAGYCYTQLTDVEQETNGLLTADRKPKAEIQKLRAIFEK